MAYRPYHPAARYHPYAPPYAGAPVPQQMAFRPPRAYAPSAYAPTAYAPRAYAPRPPRSYATRPPRVPPPMAVMSPPQAAPSSAVNPHSAQAGNYKGELNMWLQKHGHNLGIAYLTGPNPTGTGFMASLTLPIEGGNGMETVSGYGSTKKEAEVQAAKAAIDVLAMLGLLDAPCALPPSKSKLRKQTKNAYMVDGTSSASADPAAVAEQNDANFEALKQLLVEKVTETPGKRARAYLMMFPVEEQRKRVQAALYALERDGVLAKSAPTTGTNMAPFWHPVGYTGPFGGNIDETQLGEGRSFPLQDIKAAIFDVLATTPHLNCIDIRNRITAEKGETHERKIIQACLYQMEKDGHAKKTLCMTPGPGPKWPSWEIIMEQ